MLVAIATLTSDPLGGLVLDAYRPRSKTTSIRRRATRTPTLDGSSALIDSGYSDTDRTIVLDLSFESEENINILAYIYKAYSSLILMLPDGAYRATPESLGASSGSVMATFLITGPGTLND